MSANAQTLNSISKNDLLKQQYDYLREQEENEAIPRYSDAISVSNQVSTSVDKKLYKPEVDVVLQEDRRSSTFAHFPQSDTQDTSSFFTQRKIIPSIGDLKPKIDHLKTLPPSPERDAILKGLESLDEFDQDSAELQGSITQFIKG